MTVASVGLEVEVDTAGADPIAAVDVAMAGGDGERIGAPCMPKYPKLVRDRIPEIIRARGQQPVIHVADDAEFLAALKAKVVEEAEELRDATGVVEVEEVADVLEVLRSLADALGVPWATIEEKAAAKAAARGGFTKRIIVERVE